MLFTPLLGNPPVKGLATRLDFFIKEVTHKGQLHHSWSYSSIITFSARCHCGCPVNVSTSDLLNSPVEEWKRWATLKHTAPPTQLSGKVHVHMPVQGSRLKQVIRVKKTRGAADARTRITWASFLGSEEPSLKLLRSAKLQRTNSSPISNCQRSTSAIFLSCNINYNINLLLWLRVGMYIIYIYNNNIR